MSWAVFRCQCRSPGARAVENEFSVFGKEFPVIGRIGVDPHFQHAARHMTGA